MRPDDPTFLTREDHRLPGVKRVIQVANPAAGADWQVSVPGGRQWRIQTLTAVMVVSAAAGTRQPELRYRMSDVTVCDVIPTAGFAGAGTWGLTAFVGAVPGSGGTTAFNTQVGLPAIWLPPGTTFGPVTRFLDVADQWSAINLLLEECYADDTQLSEAHLEREQEERALAEHSRAILIGG